MPPTRTSLPPQACRGRYAREKKVSLKVVSDDDYCLAETVFDYTTLPFWR